MRQHVPRTILLVDDQPLFATVLTKLLEELPGWTLAYCQRGREALAMARELQPDLVLQDLHMPDADGIGLVQAYARDPALSEMAVVVLSSDDNPRVKEAAFASGAHDFIVKMPDAAEFRARLVHAANYNDMRREQSRMMAILTSQERTLENRVGELLQAEREQMRSLDRISRMLSTVTDLDVLLKRLLAEARGILGCEAGSILLAQGDRLAFTYAQNDVLNLETRFPDLKHSPVHLPIDRTSIAGAAAVDGLVVVHDAYAIPPNAPFRFNASFDKATGYRTRAVLAMALKDQQGRLLGVLQLINPRSVGAHRSSDFTESDQKLARHFGDMAAMALDRSQMTRTMILRMMRLAEMRDPKETGAHVKRVAEVSARLHHHWALRHGLPAEEMDRRTDLLRTAAMLHDVGKVGIPDAVLKKPGKLDPAERAVMETHTLIGASTLLGISSELDRAICDVTLYHHARWDGAGYPSRADIAQSLAHLGREAEDVPDIRGEAIPLFARIVAIADVFDALLSPRVYKEPWPPEAVKQAIAADAGTHFDPELAELFIAHFDEMCQAHAMFME